MEGPWASGTPSGPQNLGRRGTWHGPASSVAEDHNWTRDTPALGACGQVRKSPTAPPALQPRCPVAVTLPLPLSCHSGLASPSLTSLLRPRRSLSAHLGGQCRWHKRLSHLASDTLALSRRGRRKSGCSRLLLGPLRLPTFPAVEAGPRRPRSSRRTWRKRRRHSSSPPSVGPCERRPDTRRRRDPRRRLHHPRPESRLLPTPRVRRRHPVGVQWGSGRRWHRNAEGSRPQSSTEEDLGPKRTKKDDAGPGTGVT